MICPRCSHILSIGDYPFCPHEPVTASSHHPVLPSETAVYIRNPQTGEVRVPGRADRPIHPKFQAAGFTERVEIRSGREMREFERRTGLVHERSSYNNSGRAERDTGAS